MATALAHREDINTDIRVFETGSTIGRYVVACWLDDTDEPITFTVGSPVAALEAVMWVRGDPRVCQVIVTDTYDGRQLTVWTR